MTKQRSRLPGLFNLKPIGSDHRIVTAKVKLSVRCPPRPTLKKQFCQSLPTDKNLANRIDDSISSQFDNLPEADRNYSSFVSITNNVGTDLLPQKSRPTPSSSVDVAEVVHARKATLRSTTSKPT